MQKWYSSYFKILKIVQAMNDETSKKIYSLAFHRLTQYGIGFTNEAGELIIQDGMDIFKDISVNQQPFEISDDTDDHLKSLQNLLSVPDFLNSHKILDSFFQTDTASHFLL